MSIIPTKFLLIESPLLLTDESSVKWGNRLICEGMKRMEEIKIDTQFITLGQLLKMTDVISSGGMAKWFLEAHTVYLNGEEERRRGKKIYDGDVVNIPGTGRFKISATVDGQSDVH